MTAGLASSGRARAALEFIYDDAWLAEAATIPLSLSIPLSNPHHPDAAIRPFLWGLLPDNDQPLESWGCRVGVSPRNPFALLGEIGEDLQGAIQMVPAAQLDALRKREGVTALSRHMLAERLAELIRQPGATQFTEGAASSVWPAHSRRKHSILSGGAGTSRVGERPRPIF